MGGPCFEARSRKPNVKYIFNDPSTSEDKKTENLHIKQTLVLFHKLK